MAGWSIHLCPDQEDLRYMREGRPWCHWGRLHLGTPWFDFAIALTLGWRFSWQRGPKPYKYQGEGFKTRWTMINRKQSDA